MRVFCLKSLVQFQQGLLVVSLSFDNLYVKTSKALRDIFKSIASCTDSIERNRPRYIAMVYLHSLNTQIIIPSCNLSL